MHSHTNMHVPAYELPTHGFGLILKLLLLPGMAAHNRSSRNSSVAAVTVAPRLAGMFGMAACGSRRWRRRWWRVRPVAGQLWMVAGMLDGASVARQRLARRTNVQVEDIDSIAICGWGNGVANNVLNIWSSTVVDWIHLLFVDRKNNQCTIICKQMVNKII